MKFNAEEFKLVKDGLWCYLAEGLLDDDGLDRVRKLQTRITAPDIDIELTDEDVHDLDQAMYSYILTQRRGQKVPVAVGEEKLWSFKIKLAHNGRPRVSKQKMMFTSPEDFQAATSSGTNLILGPLTKDGPLEKDWDDLKSLLALFILATMKMDPDSLKSTDWDAKLASVRGVLLAAYNLGRKAGNV